MKIYEITLQVKGESGAWRVLHVLAKTIEDAMKRAIAYEEKHVKLKFVCCSAKETELKVI